MSANIVCYIITLGIVFFTPVPTGTGWRTIMLWLYDLWVSKDATARDAIMLALLPLYSVIIGILISRVIKRYVYKQ